jgi:hypothetical protein
MPLPINMTSGKRKYIKLVFLISVLKTVKKTASIAVAIAIYLTGVICSLKYTRENRTGKTIDNLFAKVVTVIPAFCDELPIRKNIAMKRDPRIKANGNHDFDSDSKLVSNSRKNPNPRKVATK